MQTARLVIIGNEILTGKVTDANTPFLAAALRALGARLDRVVVVPDEVDVIAAQVREASGAADAVFTSGGVGPTHDDVTMSAVAAAFDRGLVRHEGLASRIAEHYGDKVNEAVLTMADVPEGALLIEAEDLWVPVVVVENCYVFPGIPSLFRKKFAAVAERFRGAPVLLRSLYLSCGEGEVAAVLREAQDAHGVEIGSYPRIDAEADYRVRVTIESREADAVRAASAAIEAALAEGQLLRVEGLDA